jgi:hypothetical protein
MHSTAFRPAWWLVFWGLLTSLSLNWVLPVFDHHAAEYNPFHTHRVVGAVSPDQRAHRLADHHHGAGQPHVHGASAAPSGPASTSPSVVGFTALDGLLDLAARAGDLAVAADWALPQPPLALWLAVGAGAVLLFPLAAPPPIQPPRFA